MRRFLLVLVLLAAAMPVALASNATFHGSLGDKPLNQPIVGMASTPSGEGYWLVASDGGVFTFGDAVFYGSAGNVHLEAPIVGMAATPTGHGYWLVASDGGLFQFGDAAWFGSAGAQRHAPTVAIVPLSTGAGYWLVDADGTIWSFGRAPGVKGPSGLRIVNATRATDRGLWLVTANGVVAPTGDAPSVGDLRTTPLNQPIVGIAPTPSNRGFWLVATDGGIFTFGDATFYGSTGALRLNRPIVGMASSPGTGYWFVASDGGIFTFSPSSKPPASPSSTCTIFPADNPWNTDISHAALNARSAAWVASIGASANLHPDFGTPYGIPYVEVPAGQPGVNVTFDYDDESDHALYPIPPNAPVENGSDSHVLVLSRSECKLYELYAASKQSNGSWHAGSGAIFDLRSNALRPDGWTSADAAGLPILPGLVRYDEVAAGVINHAIRFTIQRSQRGYIHPATHYASSITDPNVPPMGARFRMKASYGCGTYSREVQVICAAMKRYGMFVADNGSNWY
ncbi:MAG: hypothetical protein V7636_2341, partial [Actinomycetota bacterium]